MSKNTAAENVQPEAKQPAAVIERDASMDVTLDEYCQRKSQADKRVELLGGFHQAERAAGNFKDAESAFDARLQAFSTKPA